MSAPGQALTNDSLGFWYDAVVCCLFAVNESRGITCLGLGGITSVVGGITVSLNQA